MPRAADAAKYAEVFEKARNVDAIKEKDEPFNRGVWVGFTYKPRSKAVNELEVCLRRRKKPSEQGHKSNSDAVAKLRCHAVADSRVCA